MTLFKLKNLKIGKVQKKILTIFTFSTIFLIATPPLITSCTENVSKNSPPEQSNVSGNSPAEPSEDFLNINTSEINQNLKSMYVEWYNSLTKADWNKDEMGHFINYHSNSEQQSIDLYANFRGWFWNEALHHQQEPMTQDINLFWLDNKMKHEIRGSDWKLAQNALVRAIVPQNIIVWHGVEYQEDEFWDQLKDFIKVNSDGTHDYSQTVGQTIESYGFISTTFNKAEAYIYSGGENFSIDTAKSDEIHMPLKEKAVFEIKLRKNNKGAAYLADFDFAGTQNHDNQVLIKKNSKYKITNWHKDDGVNIFDVDYIDN